jgi:hypothetical protein
MATILGFITGAFYALYVRVRYVGQKRITTKKAPVMAAAITGAERMAM